MQLFCALCQLLDVSRTWKGKFSRAKQIWAISDNNSITLLLCHKQLGEMDLTQTK